MRINCKWTITGMLDARTKRVVDKRYRTVHKLAKWRARFAFVPTRLDDGTCLWLEDYAERYDINNVDDVQSAAKWLFDPMWNEGPKRLRRALQYERNA